MELLSFEIGWMSLVEQYRWYQFIYQFGVFVSRSSVNVVQIRKTWILVILQVSGEWLVSWWEIGGLKQCS